MAAQIIPVTACRHSHRQLRRRCLMDPRHVCPRCHRRRPSLRHRAKFLTPLWPWYGGLPAHPHAAGPPLIGGASCSSFAPSAFVGSLSSCHQNRSGSQTIAMR